MEQPTNVAETLRRARALIEDPKHWAKGALARPSKRSTAEIQTQDPRAGAWCAVGAIKRVDGPHEFAALIALAEAINPNGNPFGSLGRAEDHIVDFNDERLRRHKDIMAKFDQAIARAEQSR